MHLGEFEQLLMFAILRLEDAAYGNAIRHEIESRTGRLVSPGAVYTVLDRLETKGMVASEVTDATPERGGRRMRLYGLEPAGARALRDTYAGLRRMAQGLGPRLDDLAAEGGRPARR
ncbi:MAG: PadR family transcriptional regulator [Gemmatimonadetes bacterium]|nr:PadR family transcriptional regulator [Gemmatimonadota bacterium]